MWDTLISPLSLTSPPSVTTSSNIPFLTTPTNSNEYLDLSVLYDSAHVSMDDASSIFSTHPSTPISAPLSPEEQEIQDIVTSFNDPVTFYSPDSLDIPILYSNSTATPTNNMDTPSMTTPILSQFLLSPVPTVDMSPPTSISPSPPFIIPMSPLTITLPDSSLPLSPPSPVTTTQQKPTTTNTAVGSKKRISRKKLPLSKKKERKKEQNKTAALRYRQKKKEECHTIEDKQERLEQKNRLLKQELNGLESEVNYLKQLWAEIGRHRNTC